MVDETKGKGTLTVIESELHISHSDEFSQLISFCLVGQRNCLTFKTNNHCYGVEFQLNFFLPKPKILHNPTNCKSAEFFVHFKYTFQQHLRFGGTFVETENIEINHFSFLFCFISIS